MPPIILPQAFLHAPNMLKPVCHIGAMNNSSSTVLNLKNVVYSTRTCPKPKLYLYFFFNYIFVHCPKTRASCLKIIELILNIAPRLCYTGDNLGQSLLRTVNFPKSSTFLYQRIPLLSLSLFNIPNTFSS